MVEKWGGELGFRTNRRPDMCGFVAIAAEVEATEEATDLGKKRGVDKLKPTGRNGDKLETER